MFHKEVKDTLWRFFLTLPTKGYVQWKGWLRGLFDWRSPEFQALREGLTKGGTHGEDPEKDIKQEALVFRLCSIRDGRVHDFSFLRRREP